MPYWGANVRYDNYVVQAKVHGSGQDELLPAPNDLVEYISNLTRTLQTKEEHLAKFFAEKIATAFKDHPEAIWVTVDILTTGGRTFGATKMIEEL